MEKGDRYGWGEEFPPTNLKELLKPTTPDDPPVMQYLRTGYGLWHNHAPEHLTSSSRAVDGTRWWARLDWMDEGSECWSLDHFTLTFLDWGDASVRETGLHLLFNTRPSCPARRYVRGPAAFGKRHKQVGYLGKHSLSTQLPIFSHALYPSERPIGHSKPKAYPDHPTRTPIGLAQTSGGHFVKRPGHFMYSKTIGLVTNQSYCT